MSRRAARVETHDDATVVSLELELDLCHVDATVVALESAIALGRPVLLDLSDCTFLDLCGLRAIADAARRARSLGIAFVVVLPFDGAPIVRRLMLEVLPYVAPADIAPTRADAARRVEPARRLLGVDLQSMRKVLWETGSTNAQLRAEGTELLLAHRRALDDLRRHRRAV